MRGREEVGLTQGPYSCTLTKDWSAMKSCCIRSVFPCRAASMNWSCGVWLMAAAGSSDVSTGRRG
jgi:hypothetical protein